MTLAVHNYILFNIYTIRGERDQTKNNENIIKSLALPKRVDMSDRSKKPIDIGNFQGSFQ